MMTNNNLEEQTEISLPLIETNRRLGNEREYDVFQGTDDDKYIGLFRYRNVTPSVFVMFPRNGDHVSHIGINLNVKPALTHSYTHSWTYYFNALNLIDHWRMMKIAENAERLPLATYNYSKSAVKFIENIYDRSQAIKKSLQQLNGAGYLGRNLRNDLGNFEKEIESFSKKFGIDPAHFFSIIDSYPKYCTGKIITPDTKIRFVKPN